jgi:hypothetical protein
MGLLAQQIRPPRQQERLSGNAARWKPVLKILPFRWRLLLWPAPRRLARTGPCVTVSERLRGCVSFPKNADAGGKVSQEILWQQSRNVPFRQSRNVPLISEGSLPFPLARIVLLAAEPVKASLRHAQRRRAALTEPAASRNPFSLTRGNGSFWEPLQGDVSTLLLRGTFLLCRDISQEILAKLRVSVYTTWWSS